MKGFEGNRRAQKEDKHLRHFTGNIRRELRRTRYINSTFSSNKILSDGASQLGKHPTSLCVHGCSFVRNPFRAALSLL